MSRFNTHDIFDHVLLGPVGHALKIYATAPVCSIVVALSHVVHVRPHGSHIRVLKLGVMDVRYHREGSHTFCAIWPAIIPTELLLPHALGGLLETSM
jgi:hypothetical protein